MTVIVPKVRLSVKKRLLSRTDAGHHAGFLEGRTTGAHANDRQPGMMPGFSLHVSRYNVEMQLRRRRAFWFGTALLLLVVLAGGWALAPRGRITQENFNRIEEGMAQDEVEALLGQPTSLVVGFRSPPVRPTFGLHWEDGPNSIVVYFEDRRSYAKAKSFATPWETLKWYAKKGAAKIGVKWD